MLFEVIFISLLTNLNNDREDNRPFPAVKWDLIYDVSHDLKGENVVREGCLIVGRLLC